MDNLLHRSFVLCETITKYNFEFEMQITRHEDEITLEHLKLTRLEKRII
jgi:hypothetical protein